jgi:hypothetical protein
MDRVANGSNTTFCCPPRSPANGMEARESGLRLKAWRCTRGGYSATAARLPLKAWRRRPRPVASGSSPCSARRTGPSGRGSARGAGCAARTRIGRAHRIFGRPHRLARERQPTKHEPHGFSIERILLLVQSNCRLVRLLLRTLGFGGAVGANKYFAFRFRHREKINQPVEAGRVRHGFEFGGHTGDVTGNVEGFSRHSPVRRIVGSSRRSRGSAPSGSPISAFRSHETYLRGHPIKLSHVRSFTK